MAKPPRSEEFTLQGPAGGLEALLEVPQDSTIVGSAVVCHPHPLHGGTMQNKVAHTLARAFNGQSLATLRFNFRGVNRSEGEFDDGRGEREDVLAAVAWMRQKYPDLPLWLGGFSFGAAMAIHAAAECDPAGLVSIAPATLRMSESHFAQPRCPWLILQGDQDELVDIEETIGWVNDLDPGPELQIFPEAEHFFHGKLVPLRESVGKFVERHSLGP